jgi:hypothetical protein
VRVADIFDIKINSKKDVFGRKDMIENGYSAIFFSDISRKYDIIIKNIESRIPKELFEISNKMSENDILVNLEEFSKNNTGRAVLYVGTGKVALNGYVAVLTLKESFKNMINLKYISFYMNYSNFFRQQVLKKATGARVQRISKQDFELMEIKVPGIETQEKVMKNFESIKKDFEIVSASIENKIEKITLAKRYFMQEIFNKIEEEE